MKRIILDCDPGIDDGLAIILALKSPGLKLEAITSATGNLPADWSARNARKLLDLMQHPDIPVALGALRPLVRDYPQDPFSHGTDGLGETHLPEPQTPFLNRNATDLMREIINRNPGEITLICTAPLTNIALLILQEPEIIHKIAEVILIGGAFGFNRYGLINGTGGNPVSEWNIYVDPDSAKIVFHSGLHIVAIGLDVATHPDINLQPHHLSKLSQSQAPGAKYLQQILGFLNHRGFQTYCALIDSLAISYACDQSRFSLQQIHVDIETSSPLTRGQTVADHRHHFKWDKLPLIQAADNVDFNWFLDSLVSKIID